MYAIASGHDKAERDRDQFGVSKRYTDFDD